HVVDVPLAVVVVGAGHPTGVFDRQQFAGGVEPPLGLVLGGVPVAAGDAHQGAEVLRRLEGACFLAFGEHPVVARAGDPQHAVAVKVTGTCSLPSKVSRTVTDCTAQGNRPSACSSMMGCTSTVSELYTSAGLPPTSVPGLRSKSSAWLRRRPPVFSATCASPTL